MAHGILQIFLFILIQIAIKSSNQSSLILANRKDIRLIEKVAPYNTTILIDGLDDVVALDFHYEDNLIFWTDVGQGAIRKAKLNNQNKIGSLLLEVKTVASLGIESPEGLACDWPRRNIYWSDSSTGRIEVSNFEGTFRKILYWRNLEQPLALALDPFNGYLFWTVWGEIPKIERASMDGTESSRRSIVSTRTYYPTGLCVDYHSGRLFWLDAKLSYVASVEIDGSDRRSILQGGSQLPHPFAVTVEPGTIYWTDWNTRSIHSCSSGQDPKAGGAAIVRSTLVSGLYSPMDIHVYGPAAQPLCPNRCPRNGAGCSHLCLMTPWAPHYTCACPTGIRLLADNKTCANGFERMLLLARRTDIRVISLDTSDHNDVIIPVEGEGIKNAIAIDYDPAQGHIYWSDTVLKAIRRFKVDGSNHSTIIDREIISPDGIAIDWIARNLYWTDAGLDCIQVSKLNGSSRLVLVDKDLDQPRGIALDPVNGYMYWSDWGDTPKLERAWLDGTHRELVVKGDLGWPNGLIVDFDYRPDQGLFWKNPKIYWNDALRDRIESVNADGSGRKVIVSTQIPHSFGFSMLGDHLYWTDWQRRSIERATKSDGKDRRIIIDQLPDLMGLKAVDTLRGYKGSNKCSSSNAGCSHYCFAIPSPSPARSSDPYGPATDRAICACPEDMELMLDQKTCILPQAFLLFSRQRQVIKISLGTSQPRQQTFSPNKYPPPSSAQSLSKSGKNSLHGDEISKVTPDDSDSSTKQASAIEVDVFNGAIFWTDIDSKTINRAFCNGSSVRTIVKTGLELPGSLALDWLGGNLYWSDMGTNRVEMARAIDGNYRKVVIWKNLINPRSLAVDPSNGLLYWSTWGPNPAIEFSNLDGSDRRILVSSQATYLSPPDALRFPSANLFITQNLKKNLLNAKGQPTHPGRANALTIDYGSGQLYWIDLDNRAILTLKLPIIDQNQSINFIPIKPVIELDGGKQQFNLTDKSHPFGLALYPNTTGPTLYWSDWSAQTIKTLSSGSYQAPFLSGLDYVIDLKVYHTSRQPRDLSMVDICQTSSSNSSNVTAGCHQICVPKANGKHPHRCSCSTHFNLSPDATSCVGPNRYLLLGQDASIYRVALDREPIDMALPIGPIRGLKALAYDYHRRMIYWIQGQSILRKSELGHGEIEAFLAPQSMPISQAGSNLNRKNGVARKNHGGRETVYSYAPIDMVINHVTRQVIWTCAKSEAIMVTWLDNGTTIGAILKGPGVKPTHLCFNHISGHLFWVNERHHTALQSESDHAPLSATSSSTTTPSSRIERAQADGTRNTIIIATGLQRPTSLICDPGTGSIFWSDSGLGKIESADGLGGNRKVLVDTALVNPRGLALTATLLLWVDTDLRKLESLDRVTGVRRTYGEIVGLGHPLYLLAINHNLYGPSELSRYEYDLRHNPCSTLYNSHGNCSHLCLPGPVLPLRRCSCPLDLVLDNERSCKPALAACAPDHFPCRSGPIDCVPVAWRCDGASDCADRSDEANCASLQGSMGGGASENARRPIRPHPYHEDLLERGNALGRPDLTPNISPTKTSDDDSGASSSGGGNKNSTKRPKKSNGTQWRYILTCVGALTLALLLAASYASYRRKFHEDDIMGAPAPTTGSHISGQNLRTLVSTNGNAGFDGLGRSLAKNGNLVGKRSTANAHNASLLDRYQLDDRTSILDYSYGPPIETGNGGGGTTHSYNQINNGLPPPPPPSLLSASTVKRSSPFSSLQSGFLARIQQKNGHVARSGGDTSSSSAVPAPSSFFERYQKQLFGSRDRQQLTSQRRRRRHDFLTPHRQRPWSRPRRDSLPGGGTTTYVSVASSPTRPPPPPTSVVTSASPTRDIIDGRRRRNSGGGMISPPSLPAPANSCVDESLVHDGVDSVYDRNHVTGASTSSSEPRTRAVVTRMRPFRRRKKVYLLARTGDEVIDDDDDVTTAEPPRLPPAPPSSLCSSATRKQTRRRLA